MSRSQKIILILMFLMTLCLCALLIIALASSPIPKNPLPAPPTSPTAAPTVLPIPTPLQHRAAGAMIQCRQFIKDRLVSPSSAEFSNEEAYKVNGEPLNYHAVTGIVESQNRLGVWLQSRYRCDVHYLPGQPMSWVLDYLDIED